MKSYIASIAGIFLLTVNSFAQETIPPAQNKLPKFNIGLQLTGSKTFENGYFSSFGKGYKNYNPGIGIFARYYAGRHFAIQTGIDFNAYATISYTVPEYYLIIGGGISMLTTTIRTYATDVPVLIQYHLNKSNKIRPYLGIGLVNRMYYYDVTEDYARGPFKRYQTTELRGFGIIMHGVSVQVSPKWQFNYLFDFMFTYYTNVVGLKMGMAYTIK